MRLFGLLILSIWGCLQARAESAQPVSVSYDNIVRCFGAELADPKNSFKVDMNRLKERIDQKFVSTNSSLRYRKVTFKDAGSQLKRLTLSRVGESKNYHLSLQKIDDKGLTTEIKLSEAQRINPKNEEMANLLLNVNIVDDEYMYDETKLKGVRLSYQRHFQDIQQLELNDKTRKKSISCDNKKDFGIICTCSLK